jgi:hypothetical protein
MSPVQSIEGNAHPNDEKGRGAHRYGSRNKRDNENRFHFGETPL